LAFSSASKRTPRAYRKAPACARAARARNAEAERLHLDDPSTRRAILAPQSQTNQRPFGASSRRAESKPIIPARSNNTQATDQEGRCLRRYRRRWIVERTIGWLGNFRRLTVRYERLLATYGGFFHLACALLALRRVLK
jgi:Transposase DDE domain